METPPEHARSPLWMVTNEPSLHDLVQQLDSARARILADPAAALTLRFSRARLREVRQAFGGMIRRGEARLHRLSAALCEALRLTPYSLHSVVVGEVEGSRERFTLSHSLALPELYAHTDLDLGTRLLQRLRIRDGELWSRTALVANYVEYLPRQLSAVGVHRLITRIKAEEEIWNKVVDEIFDIDALVQRDKQLRHLSRYVKDVFGIKLVTKGPRAAARLHARLLELRFDDEALRRDQIPPGPDTRSLRFVEIKNYLEPSPDGQKRSGWQALKSVVRWWDGLFEIQIQPLAVYHREQENLTRESHTGFKAQRDHLRNQIAEAIPLFGFYRDLLRWLFLHLVPPPRPRTTPPPGRALPLWPLDPSFDLEARRAPAAPTPPAVYPGIRVAIDD